VGVVDAAGKPLISHRERHHQIEAQQGQIGEVVLGERLRLEVGVDAAQPAQAAAPEGIAGEIGDDDLPVVADDDIENRPRAVDDHPELAMQFAGTFGQITRQLAGNKLIGGNAAAVDPLERLDLARLETR
jgi:hypothetical protein